MEPRKAIDNLVSKLEEIHPSLYYNISKDDFNKYLDSLIERINPEDDYDMFYVTRCALARFGDAHIMCNIFGNNGLPISLKNIDGKFYITNTSDKYKNAKFSEVTHINGVTVKQVAEELKESFAFSTEGWLEALTEDNMCAIISLLSLPSIKNDASTISYTILQDGKETTLDFDISKHYDLSFKKNPNYVYQIADDKDVIVLKYSSCSEKEEGEMLSFISEVNEASKKSGITKFVVDLRGNTGGNSSIIRPLIEYLKINSTGLSTLVDKRVFSSGRFAVNDLNNIGSTLVGMELGTSINAFGNITKVDTPDLPFDIACSYKYFYFNNGEIEQVVGKDAFEEFERNPDNAEFFTPTFFTPEVYVQNSIEDYKNRYDRELETAIDVARQSQFNTVVRPTK